MICEKEAFDSYKEGVIRIISLSKRKKKHKYQLYKCEFCGKFHVTTATKLRKYNPKEKYPFKFDPDVAPRRLPQVNPVPHRRDVFYPATQKLLSPLQAEILKHKIAQHENKGN